MMKSYTAETWPFQYKLKPCNMPSKMIYNLRGPESYGPRGWDAHAKAEKKKAAEEIIKKMDEERDGWFSKLENSILEEGFRNPIQVHAGWLPKGEIPKLPKKYRNDSSKVIACYRLGATRLYIAQKHGLEVPCLVNDYNNLIPDIEPIYTVEEVFACFTDPPVRADFKPYGLVLWGIDAN